MPQQFGIPEDVIREVTTGQASLQAFSPFLQDIHQEHVIGVNNAYQLGPWLDCVFFGDCSWYLKHAPALIHFRNLKVTCCPRHHKRFKSERIKFLSKDPDHRFGITDNPHRISWNFNSGAAAISVAAHFGVKQIILLGFDMKVQGKLTHWHGGHGNPNFKPPFKRHLQGFPTIAADAARKGIEILNACPDSMIEAFPRVKLSDVLGGKHG